jgi:CheY-like chemotaxis protein
MPQILIVDDDKDVVPLFKQMFKSELKNGIFEFVFKYSTDEAMEYFRSVHKDTILLVISDINMPGRNGIELLKELKRTANIPIFLFTAYDEETNRKAAELFKADKYLVKPIDFNELRRNILQLVLSK